MHLLLLILLSWLALDVAVVGLAVLSAHHRPRRVEARTAQMLEQAEFRANR
jgi:hypothetical protein